MKLRSNKRKDESQSIEIWCKFLFCSLKMFVFTRIWSVCSWEANQQNKPRINTTTKSTTLCHLQRKSFWLRNLQVLYKCWPIFFFQTYIEISTNWLLLTNKKSSNPLLLIDSIITFSTGFVLISISKHNAKRYNEDPTVISTNGKLTYLNTITNSSTIPKKNKQTKKNNKTTLLHILPSF